MSRYFSSILGYYIYEAPKFRATNHIARAHNFLQDTSMNFKFYKSKVISYKQGGFTLVEILVVLGITSLLAGMVLTYSAKGRNQVALYVESAKIAQILLKAKSFAIATFNNPNVPCGYGVRVNFDENSYSLFSYKPSDCRTISNIDTSQDAIDTGIYKVIETFAIPKTIAYSSDQSDFPSAEYVFFLPPDPRTLIWVRGNIAPDPSITQTKIHIVSVSDPTSGLEIKISPAGQITF